MPLRRVVSTRGQRCAEEYLHELVTKTNLFLEKDLPTKIIEAVVRACKKQLAVINSRRYIGEILQLNRVLCSSDSQPDLYSNIINLLTKLELDDSETVKDTFKKRASLIAFLSIRSPSCLLK